MTMSPAEFPDSDASASTQKAGSSRDAGGSKPNLRQRFQSQIQTMAKEVEEVNVKLRRNVSRLNQRMPRQGS